MAEEESANDPQFLGLLQLGWDTVVFVVRPAGIAIAHILYYVSFAVLFVLRLLWRPLEFTLLPLLYLGNFMLGCLIAPIRFLAQFETLYIYLGIAAIVGIAGGFFISLASGGLQSVLGLDSEGKPHGRSAKDYRRVKRKQVSTSDASSAHPANERSRPASGLASGRRKSRKGGVSKTPTILEELDSDY